MHDASLVAGLQPWTEVVQDFDRQLLWDWHCFFFLIHRRAQLIVKGSKTTKFKHTYRPLFPLVLVNCLHDIWMFDLAQNYGLKESQLAIAGLLVKLCNERLVLVVTLPANN